MSPRMSDPFIETTTPSVRPPMYPSAYFVRRCIPMPASACLFHLPSNSFSIDTLFLLHLHVSLAIFVVPTHPSIRISIPSTHPILTSILICTSFHVTFLPSISPLRHRPTILSIQLFIRPSFQPLINPLIYPPISPSFCPFQDWTFCRWYGDFRRVSVQCVAYMYLTSGQALDGLMNGQRRCRAAMSSPN